MMKVVLIFSKPFAIVFMNTEHISPHWTHKHGIRQPAVDNEPPTPRNFYIGSPVHAGCMVHRRNSLRRVCILSCCPISATSADIGVVYGVEQPAGNCKPAVLDISSTLPG